MNIYTKGGDKGITNLIHTKNVSKSDDRIQLVGSIDELTSHLGLVKTMLRERGAASAAGTRQTAAAGSGEIRRAQIAGSGEIRQAQAAGLGEIRRAQIAFLEEIQQTLITVMAGVADPYNKDYRIGDEKTDVLEAEIDRLEALFERPRRFILPGQSRLSAEIDIARTVARRAERALASVSVKFGSDNGTKKYMNRLADYLYVLARYEDAQDAGEAGGQDSVSGSGTATGQDRAAGNVAGGRIFPVQSPAGYAETGGQDIVSGSVVAAGQDRAAGNVGGGRTDSGETEMSGNENQQISEAVVQEVIRRMGIPGRITLAQAKKLIGVIEEEAARRGKKAVIAVCNPDGNPIAVHVMDGAFLVSFDVAVRKAYTSVAVKMSTMELSALAQPGGTFYGLDKMEGGNIIIFGGGVPIRVGETIIGGLGVSGGTGEEDHSLAMYGLSRLAEILG